jgi:putative protease
MKRPEILSPAGNMEKLEFALRYGADAVYAAGENFGLRSSAGNFSHEDLKTAVQRVRSAGKRIYITANIFPNNNDIAPMREYFGYLNELKVDAVIISDIGVMSILKDAAPGIPAHVSVQANNMNYMEVKAWQQLGAKRVILARELPFEDIRVIREKCPDMELEIFVHGAICMSLSGRCLLSNYLTSRDPNRGECSQPCRWSYRLVEEKRPGQYLPVDEDDRGTYIFNSKDLCTIKDLGRFIDIGMDSFKIEGRMKSSHYAAVTAFAYKKAIDEYMKDPEKYSADTLIDELKKVSHREFTDGLYFPGGSVNQNYASSEYTSTYDYAGYIVENSGNSRVMIDVKKTLKLGDEAEIFTPEGMIYNIRIKGIADINGMEMAYTKQFARHIVQIESPYIPTPYSIIRIKI